MDVFRLWTGAASGIRTPDPIITNVGIAQEALDFLRNHLPDHEPWRTWSNFEFIADEGRVNEVDALVLTPFGFVLIEVKSRPGSVRGDAYSWTWTTEGRQLIADNPCRLPTVRRSVSPLSFADRRQLPDGAYPAQRFGASRSSSFPPVRDLHREPTR